MRSVSFMFPQRPETAHKNDGYVYVIEFDNGTVKVGQTKHPKTKARNPKSHGHDVNLWYPRLLEEVA